MDLKEKKRGEENMKTVRKIRKYIIVQSRKESDDKKEVKLKRKYLKKSEKKEKKCR